MNRKYVVEVWCTVSLLCTTPLCEVTQPTEDEMKVRLLTKCTCALLATLLSCNGF